MKALGIVALCLSWSLALSSFDGSFGEQWEKQKVAHNKNYNFNISIQAVQSREIDLPESYDLRDDPCMASIKNLGSCKGGSYIFATVAALEYAHCKKSGELVLFSEQQVIDCLLANEVDGCNKGNSHAASRYLISRGALSADAYPFISGETGEKGSCQYCEISTSDVPYATRPSLLSSVSDGDKNISNIMYHVMEKGPLNGAISLCMDDDKLLSNYTSGVYDPENCDDVNWREPLYVNTVGWGTDEESGKPYWILRAPWGSDFGLNGYFYMVRGKNALDVESNERFFFLMDYE